MATNTYRTRKLAMTRVKKSQATIAWAWLQTNVGQRCEKVPRGAALLTYAPDTMRVGGGGTGSQPRVERAAKTTIEAAGATVDCTGDTVHRYQRRTAAPILRSTITDFAFVARQKRLRIGTEWYRVDVVFFNRQLRCLIIVDLKLGKRNLINCALSESIGL